MPPRSANRKASARPKKSTPKSKQPDLESTALTLENSVASELENKANELPPFAETVTDREGQLPAAEVQVDEVTVAQPLSEEKKINQVFDGNFAAIEGSNSVIEAEVVAEVKLEEEVVVEEATADIEMIDHVNVAKEEMEGVENETVYEKNDELNTEDLVEKGENVDEGKGVEREQNEGELVCCDGSQSRMVVEINSAEEETAAAQINNPKAPCKNNTILVVKEDGNGEGDGEESGDDEENNEDSEEDDEDDEVSQFIHDPLTDRRKDKDIEIYVGSLDKATVEDDLIKVFGKFGELKATRIVRNPTTKKSKGFAFIRFANVDQAKNALSELKDGVEVRGKHVKISASQDNDTLYMGNICKTWRKEDVLQTLKHYGIEHIEEIHLPDDPKNDGKIKGFALLEFSTHSDAMAAFQQLRKPDAVFGRERSAKVAFTQTPMHPSEEVLSQVKRVYVEGLTKAWNEEKLKEICTQYGEIVKINLCQSPNTKHKDFGFITFASRESALACVEGINATNIGGEIKVKASIAKPQYKGRLQKQGFRGGFKVTNQSQELPLKKGEKDKEAESSKMKGHAKSKQAKGKRKASSEQKEMALPESRNVVRGIPKKNPSGIEGQNVGTTSKLERTNRKRKKPSKAESRGDGGIKHTERKRPSKKARGNMQGKQMNISRNPKRNPHIRNGRDSTKYGNPYAPGYAAYHQGHAHTAPISASRTQITDMEPHAGYIAPASGKQRRPYSVYIQPGVRTQGQPHAGYLEHTVLTQSHRRYIEPAAGTQAQSYAGYLQPAVVQLAHDPYNPELRRAGGHDGRSSNGSAYVGGPALPASHVPTYMSYSGYQGGGSYYQNSGTYPSPRTYY